MADIVKTPVQRTVTIALDGDNKVTHAWQQTSYVITEDGVEIGRSQSPLQNLEPKDIGDAVPQAALLADFNAVKLEASAAAAQVLDLQAQLAAAQETIAARAASLATLGAEVISLNGELAAAAARGTAAVAALQGQ